MGTDATEVTIRVLGDFGVMVDGRPIEAEAWPGKRAVELVQLLALSERRQLLHEQVLDRLWPHLDPVAARANLRKAAHHARKALGDPDSVVLRNGTVALFPDRTVRVDADEFEVAASLATTPDDCGAVADTWGGELLPTALYEAWTEPRRARLHDVQLDLVRRAERWQDVVALDPTHEPAYQALMRDALARRTRSAGVRWYGQLRDALARELGVRPDDASAELYHRCLEGIASTTPSLVGRAAELAVIEANLTVDRPHGAIAVEGEAGIGKSTLCRAAVEAARIRRWETRVVTVEEGSVEYAPLIACIEQVVLDARDHLDTIPAHARSVLAALTPNAGPADPLDGPLSRHQVIGAFQQVLRASADGSPVLLVVDDLHLADDATIEALAHMASTVRDVLIVFAYRPSPPNSALTAGLERLERSQRVHRLRVGPLSRGATEQLVADTASRELTAGLIAQIVDRADGNPFVAIELARADDPAAPSADLSEVISKRLVDVEADVVAVLRRVAVVSDDLDSASIVALTGDTEDAALRILDRALEAGVLVVAGSRYRFRHDLVRQALVEQVAPHQRAAVHRDVARRLAETRAPAATIARHWLEGDEPTEAVPWLLDAARNAIRLGAFADARRHLRSVLDHEPSNASARRLEAEALDNMGDPAALAAYDAAIESADDGERNDLVAMRSLAQLKQGDPSGALEAIAGATPTSVTGRLSEALTYAGAAALGFADPSMGTTKAAECRRLALLSGDSSAIVVASWAQAAAAHARGELHDSVLEDLRATKDMTHLAVRVFDGQLCITQRFLYGSRPYADVIAFADQLADEGARLGAARGHAFGVTLRGEAELLSGDLDTAETDLIEGGRLHRAIGGATGEALALQRLAELALRRGDRDGANTLIADALDLARVTDIGFHLLDRIYGTRIELAHDPDEAVALVDEAAEAVRGPLETCPGCRITFTVPAAIATARAGQLERARELESQCEFLAHVVMKLPAWNAAYEEVCGHIAAAEGDVSRAASHFTAASAGFADAGHPWERDRCAALARSGEPVQG